MGHCYVHYDAMFAFFKKRAEVLRYSQPKLLAILITRRVFIASEHVGSAVGIIIIRS